MIPPPRVEQTGRTSRSSAARSDRALGTRVKTDPPPIDDPLPGRPAEPADLVREIERLQTRLHQLELEINHQDRLASLGTVTALIAHEFSNILTPILSYAQLALSRPDDADLTRRALERAAEGAERAAKISNSILGLARQTPEEQAAAFGDEAPVAAGSTWNQPGAVKPMPARPDVVDPTVGGTERREARSTTPHPAPHATSHSARVRESLDRALACIGREFSKDGIDLRIDIPSELAVAMDPVALEQVLLNLLLNARKAILAQPRAATTPAQHAGEQQGASAAPQPPGRRQRTIQIKAVPLTGSGRVSFSITDTGVGMTPTMLRHLFTPFYTSGNSGGPAGAADAGDGSDVQADWGDTTAEPTDRPAEAALLARRGTGLGMVVCKRLIEHAGGSIAAESQQGVGTTITLTLPTAS